MDIAHLEFSPQHARDTPLRPSWLQKLPVSDINHHGQCHFRCSYIFKSDPTQYQEVIHPLKRQRTMPKQKILLYYASFLNVMNLFLFKNVFFLI